MITKKSRRVWKDKDFNPNRYAVNLAFFQRDILHQIITTLPEPYNNSKKYTLNDGIWLCIQALAEKLDLEIEVDYETHGHVDLKKTLEG